MNIQYNVHGPCLHEGTSKHEDLFKSLTVYLSICTILCAEKKYIPMGKAKKDRKRRRACSKEKDKITFFHCPLLKVKHNLDEPKLLSIPPQITGQFSKKVPDKPALSTGIEA